MRMQFLGLQLQQRLRKSETTTMMICLMLTTCFTSELGLAAQMRVVSHQASIITHLILQQARKFSAAVLPISLVMQRSRTPKRTHSLQFLMSHLTLTQSWQVCVFVRRAARVCSVDDDVLCLCMSVAVCLTSVIHVLVRMSACCFLCC